MTSQRPDRSSLNGAVDAALAAVHARQAVTDGVRFVDGALHVGGAAYDLTGYENVVLVGAGKAVIPMAAALSEMFGERLAAGVVIAPKEKAAGASVERVRVLPGDHPVPGDASFDSTGELIEFVRGYANERTFLLAALTGGASALMSAPIGGLERDRKSAIVDALVRSGAPIDAINAVRRALSLVKGGELARLAAPARVVTLAVSDVPGNRPEDIGSGPTVLHADLESELDAALDAHPRLIDVLTSEEWDVVRRTLRERGEERDDEDGAMPPPEDFHILADNAAAVRAAANALEAQGAGVLVMDTPFVGSVEEVAARLGAVWRLWSEQHAGAPAALVAGGESTVAIESEHGQGGRSHELALRLAMELGEGEWAAACVGTDGDDGNSGAMGAFAGPDTIRRAAAANLDADHILAAHDTARFFRDLGDQIPTRETGTNVMDLVVIVGAAPA